MRSLDPFDLNCLELYLFYKYIKYAVCLLLLKKHRLGRDKRQIGGDRSLIFGQRLFPFFMGPFPIYLG